MKIAQQLYEGVAGVGLITYMRTDSPRLAARPSTRCASG